MSWSTILEFSFRAIHDEPEGNFWIEDGDQPLFSLSPDQSVCAENDWTEIRLIIFSMGSIAGTTAYPMAELCGFPNGRCLAWAKCLREELKPYQIKVTSILPWSYLYARLGGSDLPVEAVYEGWSVAECVWGAIQSFRSVPLLKKLLLGLN